MALPIISTPDKDSSGENKEYYFACHEIQGRRPNQQDALAWQVFDEDTLTPLTPQQIGERLWTTYHHLNLGFEKQVHKNPQFEGGTTASTTVIKDNHLITATLGDAVAFAVIYDEKDQPIAVHRLNNRIHNATNPEEKQRIEELGGRIEARGSVEGSMVSRAMGDTVLKAKNINENPKKHYISDPIVADADINITSLADIPPNYKVQLITTCDGFTDGAGKLQEKENHEDYLLECLKSLPADQHSELEIAEHLVQEAYKSGSKDNISVSIQTIKPAFNGMTGIYDGHGKSNAAAHYVAKNIGKELQSQLVLSEKNYEKQKSSVKNNQKMFDRDNLNLKPFKLNSLLTNKLQQKEESTGDLQLQQVRQNIEKQLRYIHISKKQNLDFFKPGSPFYTVNERAQFKKLVQDFVVKMRPSAETHRENYRLLAYLALLVTGVGVFAIVLDQISRRSASTGYSHLFFRTDSAKALDNIVDEVKTLEPPK